MLERGEYEAAYRAYEDIRTRYAGKQEAIEAEGSQEAAAFAYAERLKGEARYEEALTYYDLAVEHDVEKCCADCHFARAGQLEAAGDYEKAFQQCENALKRAPADYDRNPIMQLRAEALFLWGDRFMQQGNYSAASSRFNKCLSEWPDGPLAGDAAVNYVDSTVASHSYQPPPSKEPAAAGRVELRIRNDSDAYSRFFFSGPSSLYVDLPAFTSNTIYLTPGIYQTLLTAPDEHVKPYAAQDDYSEPTSSYSWWEITIPALLEVPTGSGVSFEDILARLEQLKTTLPPELVGCLDGVEFKADYAETETRRERRAASAPPTWPCTSTPTSSPPRGSTQSSCTSGATPSPTGSSRARRRRATSSCAASCTTHPGRTTTNPRTRWKRTSPRSSR